ncbi:FERM domain-containing protein 4B [Globodera pallida]|nr:FERM domain-containing protein 4B [Globodera pallida]
MAKCFSPGVPSLLCRVHLANGEVLPVWMASVQQFVDELEQKVLELLGLGDDTGEEAETTALLGLAHVKGKDVQWLKRGVRMQDFGIPLTKCHQNVAPGDDALPLQMDLHLLIKFVPPSVCSLAEPVVALLFFHHARMQFFKGQIHLAIEQYIRCWVCLLLLSESNMAPMDNDNSNIVELLPPPPVPLLRHFQLGLDDVQQMVHDQFRTIRAQQSDPMEMVVEFLQLCASAPLFGCSFFSVRDKSGNDWTLALNGRAMAQLDPLDPYRPKRVWDWNSVGNFHRNGETEFVLEMLSTNKVARHASLVYPLGKQPSPSCHSPPALSQWTAASTSSPRAPHRLCFRCEHPRQCQSLWEFAVAQHRWHLHSNCREMGTKCRSGAGVGAAASAPEPGGGAEIRKMSEEPMGQLE